MRPYPIISADSHFTEPADLWLTRIDPEFRERAPHVEVQAHTDVVVCDGAPMFPVGVMHGVRWKGGETPTDGRYDDIPPSGWEVAPRLAEIERDGVFAEVLYPTVAMRFFTIEDTRFADACNRAYNTFAADFCRQRPDRFKAIAVIGLDDIDLAITELHRAHDIGLVGAMIAAAPTGSIPYHDPHYDPFWAAAAALRMPVSLHVATPRRLDADRTATTTFLAYQVVQHMVIGMIFAGAFDRHPELQLVSVENDAGWAAHLIERMDYVQSKARSRNLLTDQHNEQVPSHYWRNNVHYTFMRDRTAILARDIIGVDRLLWSSDFPHGDSTWPDSMKVIDEELGDIPAADQRAILHDNAARLYRFENGAP
jgi:predicted TIM-barrel fold metal-dependent hydrolase